MSEPPPTTNPMRALITLLVKLTVFLHYSTCYLLFFIVMSFQALFLSGERASAVDLQVAISETAEPSRYRSRDMQSDAG